MGPLIEARNLYKYFGELCAVDDVSLRVSSGEIYGLVGPDGAGKTTTMRILCGAYQPTIKSGEGPPYLNIAGYDVLLQVEQARTQIGYLPQRFSLYEDLTVLENIRFFAEVRGISASEWRPRCMDILAFVGLDEYTNRRAGFLSGGMKQKLGLAVALVHNPRVLLLDEPTTGVDPVTRQDFWQLIIRLVADEADNGRGTAVFISTPYMDEAARCTRVGFMENGRMVVEDTPAKLCTQLEGRVVEMAGAPLPLLRRIAEADADVKDTQMFGDRIHMVVKSGRSEVVIARLAKQIPAKGGEIDRLRMIPPQLEDVFMVLVEGDL
jgi:ABC-2 type transport system ATP-binding protein